MKRKVENKELLSQIEKIIGLPTTLNFNTDDKTFFGYCSVGGGIVNDFHIKVLENSCEIEHELLNINVRNEFIRWFNSYGGKNDFFNEARKILNLTI